jgi:hypothetical protein
MRKIKTVRTDAKTDTKKIARPKLGRALLRPLGLDELHDVAGGDPIPEIDPDGGWGH